MNHESRYSYEGGSHWLSLVSSSARLLLRGLRVKFVETAFQFKDSLVFIPFELRPGS